MTFSTFFRWFFLLVLTVTLLPQMQAQGSRSELEAKRKGLLRNIEVNTKLLKETRENLRGKEDQLRTLRQQIGNRRELMTTMEQEIALIEQNRQSTAQVILAMEDDIARLEQEYAHMARMVYRRKLNNSDWMFIFSAASFADAFDRWQFIKQYDSYRQKQVRLIEGTQEMLAIKIGSLEDREVEMSGLVSDLNYQLSALEGEMSSIDNLVSTLNREEKKISTTLQTQEKQKKELANRIEGIIKAQMEARLAEARKPKPKPKPVPKPAPEERSAVVESPKTTPENKAPVAERVGEMEIAELSNQFARNKGRLPAPVPEGYVSQKFGKRPHPKNNTILVVNNGINLRTPSNTAVVSIFTGQVVAVDWVPGFEYTVVVNHGDYFTVYGGLESVEVRKGTLLRTQDKIGVVHTDAKTGIAEVHLEIWHKSTKQDPQHWIKKIDG